MKTADLNRLVAAAVPAASGALARSPYDSVLGQRMAADALLVAAGEISTEAFRNRYEGELQREFGDLYAKSAAKAKTGSSHRWGMVIDLQKCIGCDTCTVSCKAENRTPPGVSYNVVLEEERGTFPHVTRINLPRPCMQCDKAPCVQVCPVSASFKLDNGITAIDYGRCIGCRYCIAACPYGARSFDFGEGYDGEMIGYSEVQAPEYGIDRGRRRKGKAPVGVARKCHFCFHRLERGEEPACIETCIGDARYFGDLNDPNSVVSRLAASPRAFRLREELGTEPRVIYLK